MGFGGGESPSDTTFQTQFTRDAPQIEAAKLGLMQTGKEYSQFGMNPWELSRTRCISALLKYCNAICTSSNRGI
jgi:hypothetical protein